MKALCRLLFCVLIIFRIGAKSEEEIGSPLRIAQCRAHCIYKFSSDSGSQKSCFQDSDCFMCWENCQLLQANYDVWGGICSEPEICFPGCQEACEFHRDISPMQQTVPVIQTRGEEVIFVKNRTAFWPRPSKIRNSNNKDSPLVYVVMRRLPGKMWRQITQTLEMYSRVPDDLNSGAMLRVLVVDRDGLLTIYSPVASEATIRSANDIARSFGKNGIIGMYSGWKFDRRVSKKDRKGAGFGVEENDRPIDTPSSSNVHTGWNLREISLIHQKVLVIAEVGWDPVTVKTDEEQPSSEQRSARQMRQPSVYYVTWEVDGGGLKGNLFTDSTCVTLSLWPDTIYHIQVELVDHSISTGRAQQSEDFVLDTHRAVAVELDTPTPADMLDPSPIPPYEFNDVADFDSQSPAYAVQHKLSSRNQQYEIVLAVGAAFILFLLLLAVLVYASCRHSDVSYPKSNVDIFSLKLPGSKKSTDMHFPKEFAPILTFVTEDASSRSLSLSKENRQPSCGDNRNNKMINVDKMFTGNQRKFRPFEKFAKLHKKYIFASSRRPTVSCQNLNV